MNGLDFPVLADGHACYAMGGAVVDKTDHTIRPGSLDTRGSLTATSGI